MKLKVTGIVALAFAAGLAQAQTMAELGAAMAVQGQLDASAAGGGLNPTTYMGRAEAAVAAANARPELAMTGVPPNPAQGFAPPAPVGLPEGVPPDAALGMGPQPGAAPGQLPGTAPIPGLSRPVGPPTTIGAPAAPGAAVPTPQPMIKVLVGRRVYCAVCGTLLDDAYYIDVLATEKDKYLDDGIHDNGVAGDDIRGNVETVKDSYIGPECDTLKNQLIAAIRTAENLYRPPMSVVPNPAISLWEPSEDRRKRLETEAQRTADEASTMMFFGYHVMGVNPRTSPPELPNILEKAKERDDILRDWNNRFLANFRKDKDDPKSDYYQLYIPEPPAPPTYSFPPGYRAPQVQGTPGAGGPATPTPNIYNGDAVIGVPGV
ncbi:MAG: hypothetical protein D6691_08055 [Candidatus Hydrogenedentota bacterium]|jgi:hypothetical protein|nr:MAG: hypothetical protein D6691_08055 [Candidatus Hydrogenedentota bacterium]GIX44794.1 MAG: hypothetical protein KatS3mg130_1202 [Candidatus Sumerlaea sp.]